MALYVHETRVRLRDTDAAGVVYFASMLALASEAFEAFLIEHNETISELLDAQVVTPVYHASCDYHRPVRAGDLLRIEMLAIEVRQQSFSLEFRIQQADGHRAATAQVIHVVVSGTTWEKRVIPERLRKALTGG